MDYERLVKVYSDVESTTKRLHKTYVVSRFLKEIPAENLEMATLMLQGKVFGNQEEDTLGVAARMVLKALNIASGIATDKIEQHWKKLGDLGLVAEKLIEKKQQATLFSNKLTIKKVFTNLRKLPTLEGSGSADQKVKIVAELLTSASPLEAKYIIRNVLEELRVGIGEGTLRDAIVWAYFPKLDTMHYECTCGALTPRGIERCAVCDKKTPKQPERVPKPIKTQDEFWNLLNEGMLDTDAVYFIQDKSTAEIYKKLVDSTQDAFNVHNNFGEVAKIAKEQGIAGLRAVEMIPGRPVKAMLYLKVQDIADAFKRVGKPAAIEYKYDGFRMQVHIVDGKVTLYTRRLEEVTKQFPEVVGYVEQHVAAKNCVFDAEAVGYDEKTKTYLPFQNISQRIKRKYDIDKLAKEFPVELVCFDVISHDGTSLLKTPFEERRKLLESLIDAHPYKVVPSKMLVTDDEQEAQLFYDDSLKAGEEGVMFKNLKGEYKPGARVGFGVKVKPVMEPLELVIVGAEWGEGKRSGWFTSFILACIDRDTGDLMEMGRVGTGIKELQEAADASEHGVTFEQLTELLKPLIIGETGRDVQVKPQVIVEVNYEEIQKSPTYSSGYALRFPRVIRLREDRAVEDISDVELIQDLYETQRGR